MFETGLFLEIAETAAIIYFRVPQAYMTAIDIYLRDLPAQSHRNVPPTTGIQHPQRTNAHRDLTVFVNVWNQTLLENTSKNIGTQSISETKNAGITEQPKTRAID